jgi:hypothetical protein
MMDRYICKECGAEATVGDDGKIVRTCEHNTTIILELNVVVTGESNLA